MKAKPPFQVLVIDDNGREIFSGYVANRADNGSYNLDNNDESQSLGHDISRAIENPTVDKSTNKWYAH